jgi:mono/diheme cytochrome c family protein
MPQPQSGTGRPWWPRGPSLSSSVAVSAGPVTLRRRRPRPLLGAALVWGLVAVAVAGCGGEDEVGEAPSGAGAELADVHGCTSCHGEDGQGRLGPPWRGLAGTEVELADGTTVLADTAYLRRAITDPRAEIRAGYSIPMPTLDLTEQEVSDLVSYVESFR